MYQEPTDEQTDEQLSEEDAQAQLEENLQVFGTRLSKLASDNAAKRSLIEERWLEDYRQYHGKYDERTQQILDNDTSGSKIFVNITRNKTSAAEARLQDMLFPTDDRNWAIRPTPIPTLANADEGETIQAEGQQIDKKALANEIQRAAKKKSEGMQRQIDDQLNESKYQLHSRDKIHDACLLGTSILKGPVIVGRSKKKWTTVEGMTQLSVEESLDPSVERVDPWDFFPDMSARTLEEAEFIFERHRMNKKQLRAFAKLPGVMRDQLREVMRSETDSSNKSTDYTDNIRAITGVNSVSSDSKYELWEYHGPINKDELVAAGVELEDDDDPLTEYEGIVFFIGSTVIRAVINPMDTEDHPYSVFNWEKDDASIFGFGIPYLMRNPQKVINATWRMMLDNGGMSVADQIVVNRELVSPADGNWTLAPKKLWYLKDKTRSVNDAFSAFSTQSHQTELANMFSMARQLADEETNMPLIAQGEQSSDVTKTSSGMAMLMNSANIVLRRAVKNWDDDVTGTLIPRFYDWNMQFSEDEEIKGDFTIDARGSSALLVREKQQESLMVYANISGSNPHLAMRRDWGGLDKKIAQALEVPYDDLTLPDDEIKEAQKNAAENQPKDPQIVRAELQAQADQQKLQFEGQRSTQEFQLSAGKLRIEQQEIQLAERKLQQDREIALVKIASDSDLTVKQLEAKIETELRKDKTARDKVAVEASNKQTETQLKAQNLARGHDTYG